MRRIERHSAEKISKERSASPSNFFDRVFRIARRSSVPLQTRFTARDAAFLRALASVPESGFCAIDAVARRCPHGLPQVLRCSPMMRGRPFPTSYWLVCPYLTRIIGVIEAENGVASLQEAMRGNPGALGAYHVLHARIRLAMLPDARKRFLRRYRKPLYRALARGGIGGIAWRAGEVRAKCVHLHAASYLALGFHPASRFLDERVGRWSCRDGDCLSNSRILDRAGGLTPPLRCME